MTTVNLIDPPLDGKVDPFGRFALKVQTLDNSDPPVVIGVARSTFQPAQQDGLGGWTATDVSGQPQEVQNAAKKLWTPAIVTAYKTKFAYTVPPPPDLNAMDQDALNSALTQPGSVMRAVILIFLQEINTLRQKAALPQYTQQQLVAALKAKMR